MDIIIESLPPTPKAWLLNSALAPHLESYCAHFRLGRYATNTSQGCVAGLAHFARWMTQCGLAAEQLDAHKVEQFLNEHLPCCDCPKPVRRNHGALRAALGHLLTVLLEQGVIHAPPAPTGEIADELRRYDDHMNKSRGLSEGTRRSALCTVRQLLLHAFAGRPVVIAELKPDDVRKFIAERLNKVATTSNAIMLASALRAYFRYRATCGDQVYGLIGVISSPAHWNLASLPQALKSDEVARLLASFNASLPSPKRGYPCAAPHFGVQLGQSGKFTQRGGRCAASSQPQHLNDLRQTGQLKTGGCGLALAWEYDMSARTYLQTKVDDYLAERRQLGFELHRMEYALRSLVSYVERSGHEGALTADLMTEWARLDKKQSHLPATGARRIEVVRPFARWLCQFEPLTEVPDESAFGPVPGRVAPHIYREDEIIALLGAARDMEPKGCLRAATFETLFGLIASAGLRVSEALALLDSDVDLKDGALTVRLSKCKKWLY